MKSLWILCLLFTSFTSQSKELSNDAILGIFSHKEFCTDYGVTLGLKFHDYNDNYIGLEGKILRLTNMSKKSTNKYPQKECVVLPEKYQAEIIEKDFCEARVILFPKNINKEKVKYLFSKIHEGYAELYGKRNFEVKKIPFKTDLSLWNQLSLMRKDYNKKKYQNIFLKLQLKTMKLLKLSQDNVEIVTYGYAGCH